MITDDERELSSCRHYSCRAAAPHARRPTLLRPRTPGHGAYEEEL